MGPQRRLKPQLFFGKFDKRGIKGCRLKINVNSQRTTVPLNSSDSPIPGPFSIQWFHHKTLTRNEESGYDLPCYCTLSASPIRTAETGTDLFSGSTFRIPARGRSPRAPRPTELDPAPRNPRDLIHGLLIARQLTALQGLPDEGPFTGWNRFAKKPLVCRSAHRVGTPLSEVAGIRMEPGIAVEPHPLPVA